ncbi:hypothetical protein VPH35_029974 [Triticum aestivum]
MALASASSSPTPSAASTAAAAMAAAALAFRKAAPTAGGRLSRAGIGLPPRPSVAASPAAHPPLPGVAAMSSLGVACAAPDPRAPGLMDGGLGCLPSCTVQSTPTPTAAVGVPSLSTAGAAMSFLGPAEAPPSSPAATAEAPFTTAAGCATSPTTAVEVTPSSTPAGTAPSLDPERSVSWSSLTDDEEDEDDDEIALRTPPPAAKSSAPATRSGVTCGADACGDWQEVLSRRNMQRLDSLVPALAPRPVPAWLWGRCCRCLLLGHRTAVCRDPFRCSRCLENGHRTRECRNAWRPLSFLGSPTMSPLPRLPGHQQALAPRKVQKEASHLSKTFCHDSWASIVAGPTGSMASADFPVRPALEHQAKLLRSELLGMTSL